MFAIPFGRIFWKEYRTNRAIWLACLMIGVSIQVFFALTFINSPERATVIVNAALFTPIMYAIGCGAVMFASEREDGTADWLLTLSVPVPPILFGKAIFAIASTVVLQIVTALVSLVLIAGAKPAAWFPILFPFGLAMLIWSCLGSLLSRRVMTSVFATAFWLFPLTLLLQAITELVIPYSFWSNPSYSRSDFFDVQWQTVWWINGSITFGVDCWLGWRWCRGKYADGTVLEKWLSDARSVSDKLLRRTAAPNRLPVHAEFDQAWRRAWQRLIWQERHRSRIPWVLFQFVCILSVMLILVRSTGAERTGVCGLLCLVICWTCAASPIAMGWLSFQVDSSLQQPRFLANHGISYGSLWLAKQYAWLPRPIFIPLAMGSVAVISWCIASEQDRGDLLRLAVGKPSFPGPLDALTPYWWYRGVWFVLLSYACGQLASLLFRRTVLAIVVSGFFVSLVGMWYGQVDYCRLPLEWPLGLPFLAMMSITLWQMKPWLLEDQSWLRCGKVFASLLAIPVVLMALLCGERLREVCFIRRIDSSLVEEFNQQVQAQSDWYTNSLLSKPVVDRMEKLSRASGDATPDAAGQLIDMINQINHDKGRVMFADIGVDRLVAIQEILRTRSRQLINDGRFTESLNCSLANLKLARSFGQGDTTAWKSGVQFQRSTLEDLVTWANRSTLTAGDLRNAITRIEEELSRYPSFSSAVIKLYVEGRVVWILSSRAELPSEQIRARLLLDRQAERDWLSAATLENKLAHPGVVIDSASVDAALSSTTDELQYLVMTAPLVKTSYFPISDSYRSIKDRLTDVRAVLIRLNLIAYRLEHESLPDRLIQLLPTTTQTPPSIKAATLFDPWSGRLFDYYPTFLFSSRGINLALFPESANQVSVITSSSGPGPGPDRAPRIELNTPIGRQSGFDSDRPGGGSHNISNSIAHSTSHEA